MTDENFEVAGEDKVDYAALGFDDLPDSEPDKEPDTQQPDDTVSDDNSDQTLYSEPDNEPDSEPQWSESDEDLARKFGWKPRTEWKGDVPPTFVDDPREFVASKTRALDEFSSLKDQLAATRRELLQLSQRQGEALKSQAESRVAQIQEAYDKAFDMGDKKRASELLDQLVEAKAQAAREVPKQSAIDPITEQATQSPNFQAWVSQNPWYMGNSFEDAAKRAYADQIGPRLLQERGLSPQDVLSNPQVEQEFYNAVAKEVNRAYGVQQSPMQQRAMPDIPQQQGRQSATQQRRSKAEKSFASLPDDAKAAFAYYVKRGVYQDSDKDRAEYTREFLAQ